MGWQFFFPTYREADRNVLIWSKNTGKKGNKKTEETSRSLVGLGHEPHWSYSIFPSIYHQPWKVPLTCVYTQQMWRLNNEKLRGQVGQLKGSPEDDATMERLIKYIPNFEAPILVPLSI